MSIFSWMSRPAWQSRDTAKRAAAVATGREAALVAELPQIVRNAEASVRRAALERIDDLTLVADRTATTRRRHSRACPRAWSTCSPAGRRRAPSGAWLAGHQSLLEQTPNARPRLNCAGRPERCKRRIYAERVLEDADADLRIEPLARVDQTATLSGWQQARPRTSACSAPSANAWMPALAAGESDFGRHMPNPVRRAETHLRHPGADARRCWLSRTRMGGTARAHRRSLRQAFRWRFADAQGHHRRHRADRRRAPEPTVIVVETAPAESVEVEPIAAAPALAPDINAPDPASGRLSCSAEELPEAAADFERGTAVPLAAAPAAQPARRCRSSDGSASVAHSIAVSCR
jgi:hypothetical protein